MKNPPDAYSIGGPANAVLLTISLGGKENGSPCTNSGDQPELAQELGPYSQSQRWNSRSVNNYFAFALMEESDPL